MRTALEPRLQRQLLSWLLWPLLVLLVLDAALTWWASYGFSHLAHDRSLHEIARELGLQVHAAGGRPRLEMTPTAERILLNDRDDRLFFRVAAADGQLIGGDPALPSPHQAPVPGQKPVFYSTSVHGLPVRALAAWLPFDPARPAETVLVLVAETQNKREQLARDILLSVIVPQLLLILLAAGVVYFGVSLGLRPLRRLATAVSARSHVHLSPIELHGIPAEVRPLVEEVNELMLRLGKALDFQSRFVADAAHQLKTPVSGLKAQIELALREDDPQRLRQAVAQLHVSTERLARLMRQLLALARNEPSAVTAVQLQPLDLRALALEASMDWVPQALRSGIDLGFDGPDSAVLVDGEADRLREMLNNLVDNAIRYSRPGGRVTVGVHPQGSQGGPRLFIADDGQRIPDEERSRIFERFHRLLGTQADGSGLGLAIVSEIATLHGASIALEEDADGVGNRFNVDFPAG